MISYHKPDYALLSMRIHIEAQLGSSDYCCETRYLFSVLQMFYTIRSQTGSSSFDSTTV